MRIVFKYITLIGVLSVIIFLPIFIFQKFQIESLIIITDKPKVNGLNILNRNNLLLINEKYINEYLQRQNPDAASIRLAKKFPRTIILEIERRIPVAQIANNSTSLYIDANGITLTEENKYSNLPRIEVVDILILPNQKADWRVTKAVSLLEMSKKQGIIIEYIKADDTTSVFTAITETGMQVLLPYDADLGLKVSSLQVIVGRFKIVGKNITKVDFRFDKPLVTIATGEKISSPLPIQ